MSQVSVWVAIGALFLTIMASTVTCGFFMGRMFERLTSHSYRIKELEDGETHDGAAGGQISLAVARLEIEMKHATTGIEEIKSRLGWMGRVVGLAEEAK